MSVVNGPQFQANIARRGAMMSKGLDTAAKAAATKLRTTAAKNTPVDTGNLRQGWQGPIPAGRWTYEVRNDVEYGKYVEFGTWKMAGRFMLTRAVHEIEPQFHLACRAAVRQACM